MIIILIIIFFIESLPHSELYINSHLFAIIVDNYPIGFTPLKYLHVL